MIIESAKKERNTVIAKSHSSEKISSLGPADCYQIIPHRIHVWYMLGVSPAH